MFRTAHILLTIAGIIACPFACMEPIHGGDKDCQFAASGCHRSDVPPCCGAGCCGSHAPGKGPGRSQGGCSDHPCVCNGALEARAQRPVGPTFAVADALPSHPLPLFVPERSAAGPASRSGDAPPFSSLGSGHAIRLALESLLL